MNTVTNYKVTETNNDNEIVIHVFRDKEHFLSWLRGVWGTWSQWSDQWTEMLRDFNEMNVCRAPDFSTWEEYDSLSEFDHTQDFPV